MDLVSVDSIIIELNVVAAPAYEEGQVYMHGNLELYINGVKPYNDYSDIIQTKQLFDSMLQNGTYFIFSCCCGEPSCSNWQQGIQITHEDQHVKWVDKNNDQKWLFDRTSIDQQLNTLKTEALFYKQFFLDKNIDYVGVGYQW